MQSRVEINNHLPDGVLAGFTADGRVVVCIEFSPTYKFVFGSLADNAVVAEWQACAAHVHRIAMVEAWRMTGHGVVGNA